jgi:ferritin-like metal-binding protein YciE
MQPHTHAEIFIKTLKDVLDAERKNLRALPMIERKATDPKIRAVLSDHRDETEDQILRLEELFTLIGVPARRAKFEAIAGHIEKAQNLIAEIGDAATMDAALISLAEAIEDYAFALSGTVSPWARELSVPGAPVLLKSAPDEEYAADKRLSKAAEDRLNATAAG